MMKAIYLLGLSTAIFSIYPTSELDNKMENIFYNLDTSYKKSTMSSIEDNSLFQNIMEADLKSGIWVSSFYKTGEIYCNQTSTYELTLGTYGNGGKAEIFLGNMHKIIYLTGSSTFEKITVTLPPGWNQATVMYAGVNDGDHADIKFTIDKINGQSPYNQIGYQDLSLFAICRIFGSIGGGSGHGY